MVRLRSLPWPCLLHSCACFGRSGRRQGLALHVHAYSFLHRRKATLAQQFREVSLDVPQNLWTTQGNAGIQLHEAGAGSNLLKRVLAR